MIFKCAAYHSSGGNQFPITLFKIVRRMSSGILVIALSIMPFFSLAQHEDSTTIRKMADEILTNSKAYEDLRVLCKNIGGRMAGSAQMYKAEAWALNALQNAGAEKVWLQQCAVPRWIHGGKDEGHFINNNKKQALDVLALGNS